MSALDGAVLVLNSGWTAVHIAPVRRAISLVYCGTAHVVNPEDFGTYDFDGWLRFCRFEAGGGNGNGARYLRSVNFRLRVPEIIRLRRFGGRQSRKVRFTRRNLFERDGHTCQYCGRRFPASELTLDHVVPRSRGGKSTWRNLVVACIRCNDRKKNKLPREAGMRLLRQPERPMWSTYLSVRLGGKCHESWRSFIDSAGWESELSG
jgi:5-methylcytosine-specific restriction endonuclease McrA